MKNIKEQFAEIMTKFRIIQKWWSHWWMAGGPQYRGLVAQATANTVGWLRECSPSETFQSPTCAGMGEGGPPSWGLPRKEIHRHSTKVSHLKAKKDNNYLWKRALIHPQPVVTYYMIQFIMSGIANSHPHTLKCLHAHALTRTYTHTQSLLKSAW